MVVLKVRLEMIFGSKYERIYATQASAEKYVVFEVIPDRMRSWFGAGPSDSYLELLGEPYCRAVQRENYAEAIKIYAEEMHEKVIIEELPLWP